ncbi:monooxygenase [Rhodotorula toruloides]|uniref:Monooxygenase n=1 Tax=Rhodotorula toruloides TaxID=5286 RepID=A0A511KD78_RHOTO|nr:monooxygenase [Rhodotorula toruloides]
MASGTESVQQVRVKQPEERLKVVVIGAGLGGLAAAMAMYYAGYEVVVYEKIKNLGVGENALRLLTRWGVRDKLIAIGNKSPVMHIRRWDTGEIIATQRLMDMAGYIGHRAQYHASFLSRVEELGIPVHMGTAVASFDEFAPSVTLETGEVVNCDLVIGADGIKSRTRELVLGFEDKPKSSGYACYRAYTEGDRIRDHPDAGILVNRDDLHIVQNTCRNGGDFNWIITHKDDEDIAESWSQPGKVEDAVALVREWDPTIIVYREPLSTWISKSGKVVLLGDSAHPHLPTSAQGASQAVEDAATLAICLELAGRDNIRLAALTYERLRYARVLKTQKTGEDTRRRWHNALREIDAGREVDPESVKMQNEWIYALDAEADTHARFAAVSAQIKAELAVNNDVPILPMSLLGDDKFDVPSISDERRREVAQMAKDMFDSWESSGAQVYKGKKRVRNEEGGAELGGAVVAAPVEPAGVAVAAVGA